MYFQKQGKWCAVHVRVAWEIYHHQQKQHPEKGAELKPGEPLRPPSHLLPGSSLPLHRPPELGPGTPVSLFGGGMFTASVCVCACVRACVCVHLRVCVHLQACKFWNCLLKYLVKTYLYIVFLNTMKSFGQSAASKRKN